MPLLAQGGSKCHPHTDVAKLILCSALSDREIKRGGERERGRKGGKENHMEEHCKEAVNETLKTDTEELGTVIKIA